jgi:hypothetical protein
VTVTPTVTGSVRFVCRRARDGRPAIPRPLVDCARPQHGQLEDFAARRRGGRAGRREAAPSRSPAVLPAGGSSAASARSSCRLSSSAACAACVRSRSSCSTRSNNSSATAVDDAGSRSGTASRVCIVRRSRAQANAPLTVADGAAGTDRRLAYVSTCASRGRAERLHWTRARRAGARGYRARATAATRLEGLPGAGGSRRSATANEPGVRRRRRALQNARDRRVRCHGGARHGCAQRRARRRRRARDMLGGRRRGRSERDTQERNPECLPDPLPAGGPPVRRAVAGAGRRRFPGEQPRALARPGCTRGRQPPRLLRRPDAVQPARRATLDVAALPGRRRPRRRQGRL